MYTCVVHANGPCHTCAWYISHIWISHFAHLHVSVTHVNGPCHTSECVMSHMDLDMTNSIILHIWMGQSYIWMGHVTHMNGSCHTWTWTLRTASYYTFECVMWRKWMGHVTQVNGSCQTSEWVMSHKWMGHVTHGPGHDEQHYIAWQWQFVHRGVVTVGRWPRWLPELRYRQRF